MALRSKPLPGIHYQLAATVGSTAKRSGSGAPMVAHFIRFQYLLGRASDALAAAVGPCPANVMYNYIQRYLMVSWCAGELIRG